MVRKNLYRSSRLIALSMVSALALSACAKDPTTTGSIGSRGGKSIEHMSVPELTRAAGHLGQAYEKRPKDKNTGLQYANVLRATGRNEQALAVMQQMVIHHPEDNDILSAYGKALAATGNFKKALKIIERAQRPDRPDWRLHSAKGAILDQLNESEAARIEYRRALDIVPNEPSVLSNLGMSYLLSGDLRAAETYLRRAIKQPGADSRVRQNLALVVGLQGNFQQAEVIARGELPPREAEENMKFLKEMLSQQSAWNLLKNSEQKSAETNTN